MNVLLATPVVHNKNYGDWAKIIKKRAGLPIEIYWEDNTGKRFIDFHNRIVMTKDFDWYVMGMDDYYPARDFVKKALEAHARTNKRFIMLNDGKNPKKARNASAFMIHKSYIKELYGTGQLFWNGYNHHGCDSELTEKAKIDNELVYCIDSIYIEVDIDKEMGRKPQTTEKDLNLFYKRKEQGFPITEDGLIK